MRITLNLEDKEDWVAVFNPNDNTIFVARDNPPRIGTRVRVDLMITNGPKVVFRGKVVTRRVQGDDSLPKGFGVALAKEEREKINYLNGYVRGGLLNWREVRRIAIRLQVTYQEPQGVAKAYTRDISDKGVFVVTPTPLPEDHYIALSIQLPGHPNPFSLQGVVGHTVVVEDEDVPGMGIRFTLDDNTAKRFLTAIDEMEVSFLAGALPDEYLL